MVPKGMDKPTTPAQQQEFITQIVMMLAEEAVSLVLIVFYHPHWKLQK
jgi:hypothetical protein